jgi:3,4-dihydroxy-2-butanone 4-phosphate synthase
MTETNPGPASSRVDGSSKIEPIEKHRKAKAGARTTLDSIEDAIDEYRRGRFVIIVDDEDRENEGDLAIAAEFATPENIAFMLRFTSGVICVPMTGEGLDRLHIPMMVQNNQATFGTAFTVSVDARQGVTTGISAADRARAIQVLADPNATAYDLVMPGHIYPRRRRSGSGRPDGGFDRSLPSLWDAAGGGDLRADEPGRHDDAPAAAQALCRQA